MEFLRFATRIGATVPTYGSPGAVGLDLSANLKSFYPHVHDDIAAVESQKDKWRVVVHPGGRLLIPTGLVFEIPEGYYGRIAPRSGLANKFGIDVLAGVIDPDYRGDVGIILANHGDSDFEVRHGDRIAQLVIEKVARPEPYWDPRLTYETTTARGTSGFGSTGVR